MRHHETRVKPVRTLLAMFSRGYTGEATYPRLYTAILNGSIPVEEDENGRLFILESNFPVVATVLGMKPPAANTAALSALDVAPQSAATEHANA